MNIKAVADSPYTILKLLCKLISSEVIWDMCKCTSKCKVTLFYFQRLYASKLWNYHSAFLDLVNSENHILNQSAGLVRSEQFYSIRRH